MDIKDLAQLLAYLHSNGEFYRMMIDPLAQFGTEDDPYLGALLLPEVLKESNQYTETKIRYRTTIANSGSHYSPAQLNPSGNLVGSFDVKFGKNDQADQITAQDYDELMKLLNRMASREAIMTALRWMDRHILRPVLDLNEKQRWDAICNALVIRTGSNGYEEEVLYSNPAGHRPAAIPGGTVANPAGWHETDGSYDCFTDIFKVKRFMAKKGYKIVQTITSTELVEVMSANPASAKRANRITVNDSGQIQAIADSLDKTYLDGIMRRNSLPDFTVYDKVYRDRSGFKPFLPSNKMVFVGKIDEQTTIDRGDEEPVVLDNTLGYYGVGVPAGKVQPGRIVNTKEEDLYPGGFYAECIEVGLPVITEPEAIFVLTIDEPIE
jgi:hypothetical protein